MLTTFEPKLSLAREHDGEYTLNAVTITPNSGYSAGRAVLGVPPNVRLLPEVLSVLLHVRTRRGPALQVLTPVRHRIGNLELGPKYGKTTLTAFVMNGDEVLGSSSIEMPATEPGPTPVQTADWYAWLNRMPPGPVSFHVTGTVYLRHPGYEAQLVPATPQGFNPQELILDLVLREKSGVWPSVVTQVNVRYDVAEASIAYTGVLIRIPDGESIHIEVENVF